MVWRKKCRFLRKNGDRVFEDFSTPRCALVWRKKIKNVLISRKNHLRKRNLHPKILLWYMHGNVQIVDSIHEILCKNSVCLFGFMLDSLIFLIAIIWFLRKIWVAENSVFYTLCASCSISLSFWTSLVLHCHDWLFANIWITLCVLLKCSKC